MTQGKDTYFIIYTIPTNLDKLVKHIIHTNLEKCVKQQTHLIKMVRKNFLIKVARLNWMN